MDVLRRTQTITFGRSETVNATAAVVSDTYNCDHGQDFTYWIEALSGSAPDVKIELTYYSGMNGTGAFTTEVVTASVSAVPSTPYTALTIDSTICKSVKRTVTGVGANGADTAITDHLLMY